METHSLKEHERVHFPFSCITCSRRLPGRCPALAREVLTMALIGIGIILALFGLCFLFIDLEERL